MVAAAREPERKRTPAGRIAGICYGISMRNTPSTIRGMRASGTGYSGWSMKLELASVFDHLARG